MILFILIGGLVIGSSSGLASEQADSPTIVNDDDASSYDGIQFEVVAEDPADYPVNGFLDLRQIALGQNRTRPAETDANSSGPGMAVFRIGFRDAGFGDDDVILVFYTLNNGTQTFASGFTRLGRPTTATPSGITAVPFEKCVLAGTRAFCELPLKRIDAGPGDTITDPDAVSYGSPASLPTFGPVYAAVDHAPCDGLFLTCGAVFPPPKGTDFVLRGYTNETMAATDSKLADPESSKNVPSVGAAAALAVMVATVFLRSAKKILAQNSRITVDRARRQPKNASGQRRRFTMGVP